MDSKLDKKSELMWVPNVRGKMKVKKDEAS